MNTRGGMPQTELPEKLNAYRRLFEEACSGLFSGGEAVTLEYEDEDDEEATAQAAAHVPGTPPPPPPAPHGGSKSPPDAPPVASADAVETAARVKGAIQKALGHIAGDFAHEFNRKLTEAATYDRSVDLVSGKYEMKGQHIAELEELLAAPLQPLLAKLDSGDLDGARRASIDAWAPLERRIRSKWQSYFVLTFQDVSVERKAARDRRKLQPSIDPKAALMMAQADAVRRTQPEGAPRPFLDDDRRPSALKPLIAVVAFLALAAAAGWLLLRDRSHGAAAPPTASPSASPSTPR